jgi:hypothetical protein
MQRIQKMMRNLRTGKMAAYDAELVESGRWELVVEKPNKGPFDSDAVTAKDIMSITLTRGSGESIQYQA